MKHPGINRMVVVNLLSGNAIEGVLVASRGHYLVLKGAVLREPEGQPATMGGEAVIQESAVDFVQIVGS